MTNLLRRCLPMPWRRCAPGVRHLLLAELLGLLASSLAQAAIAWWISTRGGAADLARYGAAVALAALIATPLLSPWGDRVSKRRLIRLANACLVIDALGLAVLAHSVVYSWVLLCLCSVLSIAANALLWPVQASILPELVPPADLPEAIRLRRGAQALGSLLGPGLAGGSLAVVDLPWTMASGLSLFVLSACVAWRIGTPPFPSHAAVGRGWRSDLVDGIRAKWGVPLDRWWTLTGALMMVCLLPATGLLLPLHVQALGLSAAWFGACGAALSVGVLVGVAGLAPALINRKGRVVSLVLAISTCAGAIAGIGLCRWAPGLPLLFALLGLCMSVTQLVGQTHRLLAIPEAFRVRMAAAHLTTAHFAAALAPALAAALLQHASVQAVYLLLAAGFGAGGLLLLLVPGLGPFLRLDHEGVRGWYGRHHPGAFTPRPCTRRVDP
jgi:MFS family permease